MVTMELKNFDPVKSLFKEIGHQLSPSKVRSILDSAGQIIAKEAKVEIELKGELGKLLKKDIGVYRDGRKNAKDAEYVLIGPRFKRYTIRRQTDQKVALIAQHMTEGFNQTERTTGKGQPRGHVKQKVQNPVVSAAKNKKGSVNDAIKTGVDKQLKKVKEKYPELVK